MFIFKGRGSGNFLGGGRGGCSGGVVSMLSYIGVGVPSGWVWGGSPLHVGNKKNWAE